MARGRRLEATFSSQVRKELSQLFGQDIFVHLLPDMRMTGKKPFDFFILLKSKFIAIEAKFIEGNSININNHIRPHQPDCLRHVICAGGKGFFLICFGKNKKALLVTPDQLDYLAEKTGRDLIKYDDLVEKCIVLERKKIDGITRWEVERILSA